MDDRADLILAQIDECLNEARAVLRKASAEETVAAAAMRCGAAIERYAAVGTPYVNRARDIKSPNPNYMLMQLSGILEALRADYAAGYLQTVEELIHADVFADFLDMAKELLAKKYKDPAAVIAGSTLEEHLRKLAAATGLKTDAGGKPKKADTLNADLRKAGAYNALEQKSVTAWLGIRNSAAHGKYDEYDHAQVEGLIRDVRDFMVRHPA